MRLSEFISYQEAVKSQTAIRYRIDNHPNPAQLENMRTVALRVFDPIRRYFRTPLGVSSFFRSRELNRRIGGSRTSQHCAGQAIDIDADMYGGPVTNSEIFFFIKDNLDFDQLIWEYGNDREPSWVHVSYVDEHRNRKQVLRARKVKGWNGKLRTVYESF